MSAWSNVNPIAKNVKPSGNTQQFFANMHKTIAVNDGKRRADSVVENAFSHPTPFRFDQKTDLLITSNNFHVVNLRKGFLTARLSFSVSLQKLGGSNFGTWSDPDRLGKLFIGYKASCQAVRELQVYANNKPTAYHTKYIVQEGFAYATLKSWSMRDKKRYVHSLYENAKAFMPDVAGTYIDMITLSDGLPHDIEMEINIPVIDFLGLQAFDKWVADFGELYLEMYFTDRSLVVCTCDPADVLDQKRFLEGEGVLTRAYGDLTGSPEGFTRRFTQVEDIFTSFGSITFTPAAGSGATATPATTNFVLSELILHINDARCNDLTSTIRGYDITQKAREAILMSLRNNPLVIPSQELFYYPFPTGPTPNGIHTNINVPYENTTCATVVFPKTSHQLTCYENPMLKDLQITIGGKFFPKKAYNTFGARFLQEQLIIADLDGSLQATKEYTDSIVNVRNHPSTGIRWANSLGDDTSFMALFQLERGDGGYVFDGIDTGGANVNTEISASPIYTGDNDTYHFPYQPLGAAAPDRTITSPPPILFLARDTFFVVDSNGLSYFNDRTPRGSQAEGD